ncbi:MAG: hypothetical protein ACQESD_03270 [Thermoplasmatota archaeon]
MTNEKCPECGAKMKETTLKISDIDVRGWTCPECGKNVIDLEDAEEAIEGKRGDIITRGDTNYLLR